MTFRYDDKEEKLVVSKASRIEYHQIQLWLTRHAKGYRFTPAFKMGVWDGKDSHFHNGKINMGLWKECLRACNEIETKFEIENKGDFPLNRDVTLEGVESFCKEFFKDHKIRNKDGEWIPFMPYDYQIQTAFKILKNRYCMAEVATSGGKSLVISIIIFYTLKKIDPEARFLIIVPSITLVTQFYENILEYYYGKNKLSSSVYDFVVEIEKIDGLLQTYHPNDEVLIGDSKKLAKDIKEKDSEDFKRVSKLKVEKEIRIEEIMSDKPRSYKGDGEPNIYIGCYQSLEKWPKEFFSQFHTVACDEAHGAKSKTLTSILKKTFGKAYNRFGVSGTFPSDDSLEILTIQSVLGPKVTQIEASKLVESGTITPMEIKCLILNHGKSEITERLNYIRKMGAGADAFRLEKDFIQASDSRLEFLKKLILKCDTNTLVLFHTIDYGTRIYNKLKAEIPDKDFYYIDGEINNKKREEIKSQMELTGDKVKILIASYGTLSTGVSINAIFNVILADSFKSEQIIIQSIGRALRKHDQKKVATIFDLVDVFDTQNHNNILYGHYREREKFYQTRKYPYKEFKINL